MMTTMAELVCRTARLEDKTGLQAMGTFYSGFDYFPIYFEDYLRDPQRHMFVAEKAGQIASFTVATVTDDDHTLVFSGSRTHPAHRGKRYIQILKEYLMPIMKERYPNLKRLVSVFESDTGTHYCNTHDVRIIMKRKTHTFHGGGENIKSHVKKFLQENDRSPGCKHLSSKEAEDTILEESSRLFPNGHIIIAYEPNRILPSNVHKFGLKDIYAVYSEISGNRQVKNISFRKTYHAEVGRVTHIDIYGEVAVLEALKHVAEQFNDILDGTKVGEKEFLMLHVPFGYDLEDFVKQSELLGFTSFEEFQGQSHTKYLVEYDSI